MWKWQKVTSSPRSKAEEGREKKVHYLFIIHVFASRLSVLLFLFPPRAYVVASSTFPLITGVLSPSPRPRVSLETEVEMFAEWKLPTRADGREEILLFSPF